MGSVKYKRRTCISLVVVFLLSIGDECNIALSVRGLVVRLMNPFLFGFGMNTPCAYLGLEYISYSFQTRFVNVQGMLFNILEFSREKYKRRVEPFSGNKKGTPCVFDNS